MDGCDHVLLQMTFALNFSSSTVIRLTINLDEYSSYTCNPQLYLVFRGHSQMLDVNMVKVSVCMFLPLIVILFLHIPKRHVLCSFPIDSCFVCAAY